MKVIRKSIEIQAPPDEVFKVVSDLAAWPRHVPHYRWIRVTENHPDHLVARMACYRGWLPIDWVVRFESDPTKREVRFTHLRGLSRGMVEVWQTEPIGDGAASRLTVTHDIEAVFQRLGNFAVRWVIQRFFIDYRVPRTLQSFSQHFVKQAASRKATGTRETPRETT